uniref:CSON006061 protein n=1 Tax=Culicoides sonorensis TaxID=179676 RepID=A0A336MWS2_CULSO
MSIFDRIPTIKKFLCCIDLRIGCIGIGLADIVFFVLGSILTLEEGIILSTKDAETYPRWRQFTNATDFIAGIFDIMGIFASVFLILGTALKKLHFVQIYVFTLFFTCLYFIFLTLITGFYDYGYGLIYLLEALLEFLEISVYVQMIVDLIAILLDMGLIVAISNKFGRCIDVYLVMRVAICSYCFVYVIAALCLNYVDVRDSLIFVYDVICLFFVHSLNQNWKAGAD